MRRVAIDASAKQRERPNCALQARRTCTNSARPNPETEFPRRLAFPKPHFGNEERPGGEKSIRRCQTFRPRNTVVKNLAFSRNPFLTERRQNHYMMCSHRAVPHYLVEQSIAARSFFRGNCRSFSVFGRKPENIRERLQPQPEVCRDCDAECGKCADKGPDGSAVLTNTPDPITPLSSSRGWTPALEISWKRLAAFALHQHQQP